MNLTAQKNYPNFDWRQQLCNFLQVYMDQGVEVHSEADK